MKPPGYCDFCERYSGNARGAAPGWARIYQNQAKKPGDEIWVDYLVCPDCLRRAGLAPRISPEVLESKIVEELYHHFPGTTTMVCLLILENGFSVVGESAAVHPDNFDEEIGRKVARQHARDQMWKLLGYQLKEDLHRGLSG